MAEKNYERPVYAPQMKRLKRVSGEPVIARDGAGAPRYCYDDGSLDEKSTVDPRHLAATAALNGAEVEVNPVNTEEYPLEDDILHFSEAG